MDWNVIIQAASTLGIPAVMCGALFWFIVRQTADHKEEMNKITEALNNNTIVMNQMLEHLRGEDER